MRFKHLFVIVCHTFKSIKIVNCITSIIVCILSKITWLIACPGWISFWLCRDILVLLFRSLCLLICVCTYSLNLNLILHIFALFIVKLSSSWDYFLVTILFGLKIIEILRIVLFLLYWSQGKTLNTMDFLYRITQKYSFGYEGLAFYRFERPHSTLIRTHAYIT